MCHKILRKDFDFSKQTMIITEKSKFIKDRTFYKTLLLISVPIIIQNIIVFMTQMLDTIMLGALGEVSMTAAALGSQPFFIFNMLTFGVGSGAAVLTSQYWGKKEIEPIKKIISMIMMFAIVMGILMCILVFNYPKQIMSLFTNDLEVIEKGAKYLKIICFIYPMMGFVNVYYISMRSVETVMIAMVSNLAAMVTNGVLNYVFIFGKFGAPEMGVEGAALATVIARAVDLSIAVFHMFFIDKRLAFKPSDFIKKDKRLFFDLVKVSSPVIANELMWASGISVQAAILGRISTTAVAANSIISVIQQMATVVVFGVAGSSAVLIGKAIGEGNYQDARNKGYTFNIISIFTGIVVSCMILISKNFAIEFYNVSANVKELAHSMVYVTAVTGFFLSIAATGVVGVLRGGGDTKYSLYIEAISLWGIAVPFAYIAAFVLKWPPILVFVAMKIDEPVKTVLYLIRMRGGRWINNVTR